MIFNLQFITNDDLYFFSVLIVHLYIFFYDVYVHVF